MLKERMLKRMLSLRGSPGCCVLKLSRVSLGCLRWHMIAIILARQA
jgi:hypothetical protein